MISPDPAHPEFDWALPPTPAGVRRRGHGLTGGQVLPVLLAIGCAVLAALIMGVSESRSDYDVSTAVVGRAATLNDAEVTVTGVRMGTQLGHDGEVDHETAGAFVAVDLELRAGDTRLLLGQAELTSGDRTYQPYSSLSASVDPGFALATSVVFEVDPSRIDDLTFTLNQTEVLSGYPQQLRCRLGITAANSDQWRASATRRLVEVAQYPTAKPVR